jgi:hypothetical protein
MRKIYTLVFVLSSVAFTNCSKDVLKPYDERIVGTWKITDVNKTGFGGNTNNLPFKEGSSFIFLRDGTVTYTSSSGSVYNGTWNIERKNLNDETYQSLQITLVNFTTQQVLGEYYDDINFTSTNHFKAWIYSGTHTYITHFRR